MSGLVQKYMYKFFDRADGVAGRFCLGRSMDGVYWSFWDEVIGDWRAAGTVYCGLDAVISKFSEAVRAK